MESWRDILGQLWILPIALAAVGAIVWMGCLRRGVLKRGPRRDVGFGLFDLVAGFGLMVMGMGVGILVIGRLTPVDDEGVPVYESATQQAGVILLGQLIVYGPPVLFVMWRAAMAREGWRRVGLRPAHPVSDIAAGAAATVLALPIVLCTVLFGAAVRFALGETIETVGHPMLENLLASDALGATVMLAASAILVAPIVEEILYRGLLQTSLLTAMPGRRWTVVTLAAAAFALQHVGLPPHTLPGLFILGIFLGWLYERTGSLLAPIVLHMGFNAVNFGMVLLMSGE